MGGKGKVSREGVGKGGWGRKRSRTAITAIAGSGKHPSGRVQLRGGRGEEKERREVSPYRMKEEGAQEYVGDSAKRRSDRMSEARQDPPR